MPREQALKQKNSYQCHWYSQRIYDALVVFCRERSSITLCVFYNDKASCMPCVDQTSRIFISTPLRLKNVLNSAIQSRIPVQSGIQTNLRIYILNDISLPLMDPVGMPSTYFLDKGCNNKWYSCNARIRQFFLNSMDIDIDSNVDIGVMVDEHSLCGVLYSG